MLGRETGYTIVPKRQARDVNTSVVASRGTLLGTRCRTRTLRNVDITATHASPMAAPSTSDLPAAVNDHIRWKVDVKAHQAPTIGRRASTARWRARRLRATPPDPRSLPSFARRC